MNKLDPAMLAKRWVHSHEEDSQGVLVFRPGTWPFPPSRGRRSISLQPDGILTGGTPGADDREVREVGSWHILPNGILELAKAGEAPSRLKVLEVSGDRLVLKR